MKEGMENLTPKILTSKSSAAVTIQDWVDDYPNLSKAVPPRIPNTYGFAKQLNCLKKSTTETHLEPCETCLVKPFLRKYLLSQKCYIIDVWQCSKHDF